MKGPAVFPEVKLENICLQRPPNDLICLRGKLPNSSLLCEFLQITLGEPTSASIHHQSLDINGKQ